MVSLFNLESHIGFYAEYHNNSINQWIHIIGVPSILWSTLVWLTYTGPLFDLPLPGPFETNAAFIAITFYFLYYLMLEPVAALLYAPILYGLGITAYFFVGAGFAHPIYISLAVHLISWIAQFIGHGIFERRAPALFDSLYQALILAPLFVWLEVLFKLGYNPELAKKIDINAKKDIATWKKRSKGL